MLASLARRPIFSTHFYPTVIWQWQKEITMIEDIAKLTLIWLKSFKPDVSIDKVITTDGQEFHMPSDFKASVEGNLSYTHRAEDVENLFDDGEFKLIRAVKLWKDMTGQNLKTSKRVGEFVRIAYLSGIKDERAKARAEINNSMMVEDCGSSSEEQLTKKVICSDCGRGESEIDIYKQGENITLYAQSGTLLCPDCIPEQAPDIQQEWIASDEDHPYLAEDTLTMSKLG